MELMILLSVIAGGVALIVWNRARARRAARDAQPPPAVPVTPEELAERAKLGEDFEDWKARNGVKGP